MTAKIDRVEPEMYPRQSFTVRRTPNHAVRVTVAIDPDTGLFYLVNLVRKNGPIIEWDDMRFSEWRRRSALRAAIMERLREFEDPALKVRAGGAAYYEKYDAKMRDQGLKQIREWIPEEMEQAFREVAKKYRDRYLQSQ